MHETLFILDRIVTGPRIEFGVLDGASTKYIMQHPGVTYAVDSFEGMDEPTLDDQRADGVYEYTKGRLAVSLEVYASRFRTEIDSKRLVVVKGFVPAVMRELPQDVRFAFAYVDMDQYAPTRSAIEWLWTRMLPGGIVFCDDWFVDCNFGASKALNELARYRRPFDGTFWRRCWWIF